MNSNFTFQGKISFQMSNSAKFISVTEHTDFLVFSFTDQLTIFNVTTFI